MLSGVIGKGSRDFVSVKLLETIQLLRTYWPRGLRCQCRGEHNHPSLFFALLMLSVSSDEALAALFEVENGRRQTQTRELGSAPHSRLDALSRDGRLVRTTYRL